AEDGIRDRNVTGVQTCALPILWIIIFVVINTVINYFGIEMTAKTNKIFLVFEIIVLILFLIFGITAIVNGVNGATFSFDPLYNPDRFSMSLVLGAVSIAVLSFLGFDAISTYLKNQKVAQRQSGVEWFILY